MLEHGTGANAEHMLLTNASGANTPAQQHAYAEGHKAGRIAALREVGCGYVRMYGWDALVACSRDDPDAMCEACRLLAESEEGEVGGDR